MAQHLQCLLYGLVATQLLAASSPLVVVAPHDVVGHVGFYLFPGVEHVVAQVAGEFGLQGLEFCPGSFHVPFTGGDFPQQFQHLVTSSVVGEPLLADEVYELLVFLVRESECAGSRYRVVSLYILCTEVEERVAVGQVIDNGGQCVGRNHDVRLDASSIAHLASPTGVEQVREAVGQGFGRPVRVQVAVIVRLDAPAAGYVVAAGGNLQVATVGQGAYGLYDALAVGTAAHYDRPVHVLQRTAQDFCGRGSASIYQDDDGHHRIDGFHAGVVFAV